MKNKTEIKCLSISKRNKRSKEIINEYSLQWDSGFSQTIFRMADEYDNLIKRIKDNKWQIVRELVET
jgi:hypothetical protein